MTAVLVRKPNPTRKKLKRFLEKRWADGKIPVKAGEIRDALGFTHFTWGEKAKEIRRWISVLGWKECTKKIGSDQPSLRGFWPPLKPVPRIDEWSELDP